MVRGKIDQDESITEIGEYEVEDLSDKIKSSEGSRLALIEDQFGLKVEPDQRRFSRQNFINGLKDLSQGIVIHPENRFYHAWQTFIVVWAVYSSCFTPMEFGFFRGLPKNLFILDIAGQTAFLVDIVIQFFVAYRDSQTYRMVYDRSPIAIRYLKTHFIFDLLGCMPWDVIYQVSGRKEIVRYLLWIRLSRLRKVIRFFQKMEKDIRINYIITRIIKLFAVELYCTHTAACIFYYLATTLPPEKEGYTWIGSLQLGDYSYSNFREIDFWKRYLTSLYFAIVTMSTVGYGEIHAVNVREMIFIMIYVSFDMILSAYLVGNMTALIVKGSKTERYRDRMADLMKFMNRNRLGRDIRNQIKGHMRLQYESSATDSAVIQDIPVSIRSKVCQSLYKTYIEKVNIFQGCSPEFINQIIPSLGNQLLCEIVNKLNESASFADDELDDSVFATLLVIRVHEEFFLPGEVILEQGNAVDQLYFVCHGVLEEVGIGKDGLEETISTLEPYRVFGIISILCNIPQPYTVRVCELCRLLRIDKQSFSNILDVYFHDGRKIFTNLVQMFGSDFRLNQLETNIGYHIGKQEAELALRVNSAAYHGDLQQLKNLIQAGADPNKQDYDRRSPLHLAASRGFVDIADFLIKEGVDVDVMDNFGNTPFLEAIKNGHDHVASLLAKEGATLKIENVGGYLCTVVERGDPDFLKRLLSYGTDPNSRGYNQGTPLHVAASEGLVLMAKLLLEAGASVFLKDRCGNTPLDEAQMCGNMSMLTLLEEAKATELSKFSDHSAKTIDKVKRRKCTVYPFHPWERDNGGKCGIVLWVPDSIEELIREASKQLNVLSCSFVLSEEGGKIIDVDLISEGQKLYLMSETQTQ